MKRKHWIRILVAIVIVIVIAILVIPLFINANTFRPTLETQLSQALGRQVTLGNLSLSLFSGSLAADNISIADDPSFSHDPFLQARSLRIGVKVWPLVFGGQLHVTDFTVDSPTIHLVHTASGIWNFSSIGRSAARPASNPQAASSPQPQPGNNPQPANKNQPQSESPQQESAFPNLTVGKLKIQNGSATVSSLPPSGKPLVVSKLNLSLQQFSFSQKFPFQLSAALPGDGSLAIDGTAGPVSQQDASETPLDAKINLKHFDPLAAGVVQPSEGISMLADVVAEVSSNGQTLAGNGTVHASRLKLVANGSPAPRPVDMTYTVHYNLNARSGQLDSLKVMTGAVSAETNGTFQMSGPQATLNLHVSAPGLPVDQLEALLPAVGVRLPSGSSLHGGTLTANLNVTGSANAPVISGPVEVDNTQLAGFNLGSKIGGLNPLGGTGGATAIQTLRANVNSSPEITRIDNLYIAVPTLGTATGSGTVTPAGSLNFHVVAKLSSSSGAASKALAGLSSAAGVLGQAAGSASANGIPVNITGTTSNPVIRADLSSVLKQNARGLLGLQKQGSQKANPAGVLNKFLPH